jgi:hypothetical protein
MKLKRISLLVFAFFVLNSCSKLKIEEDGNLVLVTVIEDATLPSIKVKGVELHSETFENPTEANKEENYLILSNRKRFSN